MCYSTYKKEKIYLLFHFKIINYNILIHIYIYKQIIHEISITFIN